MGSSILALDVGSSSIKALVARVDGAPLASHAVWTPVKTPRGAGSLAREFSHEALWRAIVTAARQAMTVAAVKAADIAAVCVTSQRQGLAFLDGDGCELYLAPNTDLRAVFEGAAQDEQHREAFYRTTGHLPPFFMAPAKLRWFQVHRPREYERIHTVLSLGDWAAFRLTGERAGERALAGEAGLLEVTTGRWAKCLMRALGLRDDWFPPLVDSGAIVGVLTASAAADLGVKRGVPVVAAGPDTQCGLLGMGVAAPGDMGVLAGWSMTSQAVTASPRFDPALSAWVGLHSVAGHWVSEVNLGDAGAAYAWVARTMYGAGAAAFRRMEREAAEVTEGTEGTYAFLGPAPLNMRRLGVRTGGLLMPVPISHAGASRDTLARAFMESTGFAVREGLERLEKVTGRKVSAFALGGGMVRSGPLAGIIAAATGRQVALASVEHVSAYGAALAGAAAVGGFASLEEAARNAASRLAAVATDGKAVLAYHERYERWRRLRDAMEAISLE
ncbi:MAG: hypothetical protein EXR47_02635 [Dehalococcoidia bacterium]|nr:hypothetical protein [Dehalococcoidia bacterium]